MSVVLPDPLGPSTTQRSPARTVQSTSASSVAGGRSTVTPASRSATGGGDGHALGDGSSFTAGDGRGLDGRWGTPATVSAVRIGILGGTGPAGKALAARLASVGFDVVVGSRSKYRAMEVVDNLLEQWSDRHLTIDAGDNATAADADLVVIATPWDGATQTAVSVEDRLRGKVVVSMANAL